VPADALRRAIELFQQAVPLNRAGLSIEAGVRAATAVALPVLIAELLHRPELSWVAVVAFWGCLCDSGGPWRERLAGMASFTVLATLVVIAALYAEPNLWLALPMTFLLSFLCSFARVYGGAASTVGLIVTTDLLVCLGIPAESIAEIWQRAGLTILGGVWAMVMVLVLWRIYPYGPARRVVSQCWRELSSYAEAIGRLHEYSGSADSADAWGQVIRDHRRATRDAIEAARELLANERRRRWGETNRGQLILVLLDDADRVFDGLIAISDRLETTQREMTPGLRRSIRLALHRLAQYARLIGLSLGDGRTVSGVRLHQAMQALDRRLANPAVALQAPAGQLVQQIASYVEAAGEVVAGVRAPRRLAEAITEQPPGKLIDLPAAFATFRANLDPRSMTLRHALRLSLTATFALYLTKALDLPRGYWLTLTAIVTLQPFVGATWRRALERVGGSVLGGVIAAVAGLAITRPIFITILIFPLSVATLALRGVNYTLFVLFLTPLFVLIAELFQTGGVADWNLAGLRALDSTIGGGLGLAAGFLLWPAWEAPLLPPSLANAVRGNRDYLAAVLAEIADPTAIQANRRAAGLASNNAEQSLQRLMGEPRRDSAKLADPAMTIVSCLRRIAGVAASLDFSHQANTGAAEPVPSTIRNWFTASLGAIADAIEQGRAPTALCPFPGEALRTLPDPDLTGRELAHAARQVEQLHAAALRLVKEPA
jgi:uncharacterized membrane protein YccC